MSIISGSRRRARERTVALRHGARPRRYGAKARGRGVSEPGRRASTRRPVMMMSPGRLADEVTRLAAAAGCDLHRVSGPDTVRDLWNHAPLLVLDAETATASANAGLPRRDGIVIVCADGDPLVWRCAVAVGAQHVVVLPDGEAWLVGALAGAVEDPAAPD